MNSTQSPSLAALSAQVDCPTCGARPAQPCISQRTHQPVAFNPHPARIDQVRHIPPEAQGRR